MTNHRLERDLLTGKLEAPPKLVPRDEPLSNSQSTVEVLSLLTAAEPTPHKLDPQ
jgi:hypothetical protein